MTWRTCVASGLLGSYEAKKLFWTSNQLQSCRSHRTVAGRMILQKQQKLAERGQERSDLSSLQISRVVEEAEGSKT